MGYSIQLKNAVLKKVLQGIKPHHEIAVEFGVGRSTIGKWLREYRHNGASCRNYEYISEIVFGRLTVIIFYSIFCFFTRKSAVGYF